MMTNKMKLKHVALLAVGLLPFAVTAQPSSQPAGTSISVPGSAMTAAKPATPEMPEKGKLSYAIGMYYGNNISRSFKQGNFDIDTNAVLTAISDVINGKTTQLTEKEMRDVLDQLRAVMQARQKARDEEAKAKSDEFMAQFAKQPGVITTNGLEYKVIKDGDGEMPTEWDTVVVSYRGTLADGKEFDHNDNFKTPIHGRVITGWQRALPMMKVGSHWQIAVPWSQAYGPRGKPGTIPGYATLIFDMELKSIAERGAPPVPVGGEFPHPGASQNAPNSSAPVVSGQIIKVPSADELKKGAKIEVIDSNTTNASAK
jgi:FKBP-type peptidyl-prolyl cis-trans isomerase FklB